METILSTYTTYIPTTIYTSIMATYMIDQVRAIYGNDEEAQLAEAIRLSSIEGSNDLNSVYNYDVREEQFNNFCIAIAQVTDIYDKVLGSRLVQPVDLENVHTFTLDDMMSHNIPAKLNIPTWNFLQRVSVHPGSYNAFVMDNIVFQQIDCGSLAFDEYSDDLTIIDSNTCLYNCIYVWLVAKKMIFYSLREFIERVNNLGKIDRQRGDFADELVMKAICDLYRINICCLWKSANTQRVSLVTREGNKKDVNTAICYLVNELGTVHFKLLVPDLSI